MIRKLFLGALVLLGSAVFGRGAEAADLRKVSIQIDGAAVPYYAPLYLAQEKGYFAEQGLDVEFYYSAGADIVKNVGVGNVEFGFPNADSVIVGRGAGIPVKVVHTTYQHGLGATIFKRSSGISGPADLKGKKVAVTSLASPNYIQLQVMLKEAGLAVSDLDLEVIGTGAIVGALADGQVDAIVFSMLRTVELRNQGVDVDEIRSDTFLPSHGNVLIAGEKLLKDEPELVEKFVSALDKSLDYIIGGHSHEAVELSVSKYAPSFGDRVDVVTRILDEIFIPYLWTSDYTKAHGLGASDAERWGRSIAILKEYGVLKTAPLAEDLLYVRP